MASEPGRKLQRAKEPKRAGKTASRDKAPVPYSNKLTSIESRVLELRKHGRTYKEIGAAVLRTGAATSQIEKRALKKIAAAQSDTTAALSARARHCLKNIVGLQDATREQVREHYWRLRKAAKASAANRIDGRPNNFGAGTLREIELWLGDVPDAKPHCPTCRCFER
jgi:hypothetical protein